VLQFDALYEINAMALCQVGPRLELLLSIFADSDPFDAVMGHPLLLAPTHVWRQRFHYYSGIIGHAVSTKYSPNKGFQRGLKEFVGYSDSIRVFNRRQWVFDHIFHVKRCPYLMKSHLKVIRFCICHHDKLQTRQGLVVM
jgi:hypothetical protein